VDMLDEAGQPPTHLTLSVSLTILYQPDTAPGGSSGTAIAGFCCYLWLYA
jgi:hypothetical protein